MARDDGALLVRINRRSESANLGIRAVKIRFYSRHIGLQAALRCSSACAILLSRSAACYREAPMFTAFVMIKAEPRKIAEIAQEIANMSNVAEVFSVTGDFDILVVLRLAEYEQLADAVPDGLSRLDGILQTNTVLAFRRFSSKDLEIAWDIGVS